MSRTLFVLIIILGLICLASVILSIKSRKTIYPITAVCCLVFILAASVCGLIPEDNQKIIAEKQQNTEYSAVSDSYTSDENKNTEKTESTEKITAKDKNRIVYITKTGTKYHSTYTCGKNDYYECTLEEALEMGLEPCGKCINDGE